jgi:hypothetical protein
MIIKGNPAGSVGFWSKHLANDEKNERAEVKEIRGLLAQDLPGALREMQGVAAGSRSHGNFMYQANINPRADEHLTPAQWAEAIDTLEKNLGLEGHQRVIVEHVKEGRQHYHIVWNRVDVETMRVTDMGGNYRVHERTARELEHRFGLDRIPSSDREKRQPAWQLWEARAAERSGVDPLAMKTELTELWRQSDSGQAFKSAIEERGYILARGDRRDFVVIDRAGDAHSLARRLDGVNARQVREKTADLDRSALPFVEDARKTQRDGIKQLARQDEGRGQEVHQAHAAREQARMDDGRVGGQIARAPLMVASAAGGVTDTLVNFLAGSSRPVEPPLPAGNAGELESIKRQRRSRAALERIKDCVEKGRDLQAGDVYALTPNQIENLRAKGDAYLLHLVESMERNRSRDHDYGRSRER